MWEIHTADLGPVVVKALTGLTSMINHNNTIAGGDEKNEVVSVLLALKSAGIPLDGEAMQVPVRVEYFFCIQFGAHPR